MTKAELLQIKKAKEKVNSLMRSKRKTQTDLYYRYQGTTFVKTVFDRQARKLIFKATRNMSIDTDMEPFLFDSVACGIDPLEPEIPGITLDIFRVILRSHMLRIGLSEREIQTWQKELITKS